MAEGFRSSSGPNTTRSRPGLIWFFIRGSAPARKWHVPQACTPSLPTCMSQNKAFPRAMAHRSAASLGM